MARRNIDSQRSRGETQRARTVGTTLNQVLLYRPHRHEFCEVKDASPMVDTKAPQTYMHMHMKLKKLQLEEERLTRIERDNRILLDKMSFIMKTKGRLDNHNQYERKSLNREQRQRELLRITQENKAVLQRIVQRRPEYERAKFEEDWRAKEKLMENISLYARDGPARSEEDSAASSQTDMKPPQPNVKQAPRDDVAESKVDHPQNEPARDTASSAEDPRVTNQATADSQPDASASDVPLQPEARAAGDGN